MDWIQQPDLRFMALLLSKKPLGKKIVTVFAFISVNNDKNTVMAVDLFSSAKKI